MKRARQKLTLNCIHTLALHTPDGLRTVFQAKSIHIHNDPMLSIRLLLSIMASSPITKMWKTISNPKVINSNQTQTRKSLQNSSIICIVNIQITRSVNWSNKLSNSWWVHFCTVNNELDVSCCMKWTGWPSSNWMSISICFHVCDSIHFYMLYIHTIFMMHFSLFELQEGAFALAFKSKHFPDECVATRRGSPLLVGIKTKTRLATDHIPILYGKGKNIFTLTLFECKTSWHQFKRITFKYMV